MRTSRLAWASLALLLPTRSDACSCAWTGPFLTVAPRAELIIRAKVTGYHGRQRGIDLAMDAGVIEVLKGSSRTSRLRIWGDNGAQCRPYVSAFPIGSEWILAVNRLREQNGPEDYFLSACGEYWARVDKGKVVGRLTSPAPPGAHDKPESMDLDQVRQRLRAIR